jgi:hypothetical protein
MESRFDTLAKLLASGMSRREALRQLSGTATGVVLAALGIGCRDDVVGPLRPTGSNAGPLFQQGDGDGGNSAFAHFCNEVFPPGPERGHCKALAAQGEGIAVACGADVSRVCATATQGLICCDTAAGQTCCAGANRCCPSGQTCCGTVCCPAGRLCDPLTQQCRCPTGTRECGTACCPTSLACCAGVCCGIGQICFNNVCRAACPGGQTPCGTANCCMPPRICNPATGTCVCPPNTQTCGPDCCNVPNEACIDGRCVELFRICGVEPCPSFPVRHACCPTVTGINRCCPPLAFCSSTSPTGCCLTEDPIFGFCIAPV